MPVFAAKYLYREDAGKDANREVSWGFIWVIILGLAAAGLGGYAVYKYRIRVWVFLLCRTYPEIFHDRSYQACSWHVDLHDVPCDASYCKEDVEP